MLATIVYAFPSHRTELLKEYYTSKGFEVKTITSDFSHRSKTYVKPDADTIIHVREYHKNLSVDRLLSHIEFSKGARKACESLNPDIIHCLVPCNSLVKELSKLKKRNNNMKLVFDIIDLWPESMPIKRFKGFFPFKIWKNLRDKYLKFADVVFCECELYKQYIHRGKVLYWTNGQNCLEMNPELKEDEISFCYLGSMNNIIDIDLITRFLEACSKRKKCVLHIIGNGEAKETLITDALCVGVNVIDHKEIYDQASKQEIFDECNYGINVMKPSVVVGLTIKSLDYMCGGLPIINTIQGDTKQFCEMWDIGFNLSEKNIKSIAKKVCGEDLNIQLKRRHNIRNLYNTYFTKKCFFEMLDNTLNQ